MRLALVRQVLTLYREQDFDCTVSPFHEKLTTVHGIALSSTWVKTALQTAGRVATEARRGTHRKTRPCRPLPGILHTDARTHAWIPGLAGQQALIAVLDAATSAVYYARFVPQESTRTLLYVPYKVEGWQVYQYTALDDCTRLRVVRFFPELTNSAGLAFLADAAGRILVPDPAGPDRQ